jgi:two-component system sensor histidine kinase CiaH
MSHRPHLRPRKPRLSDVTRRSLRVAFATTAIVAVMYLVAAGAVFAIQTKNLNDQIDYRLADYVHHGGRGPGGNSFQPGDPDNQFDPIYYWLIDDDGTVVLTNSNVSTLPAEYQQVAGRADGTISDTPVRLFGQRITDGYVLVAQSTESVSNAQSQLLWAELAVTPVLLVFVFVGAVIIGRRVATPVERARRRQLEFTADASHELRTPLSVIEANTSLALAQPRDEEWYQEAFLRVDSESKRMRRLLEDMLWLARFDATRGTPNAEPIDVAVLAGATADRFSAVAEARQIKLTVETSVPDAVVNVPPEWLDRLLGVLLDNALKFSMPGGAVRVSVGLDGSRVQLTVDDSGPGIPEADRARVFDRFHRGTESKSGAGLGLAIADAIVRATDGRWRIGSSPQGGASLSVAWPRAFSGPRESAIRRQAPGPEQVA